MSRDIIVVGGSAGSLSTLRSIAASFPRDFAGDLFIAVHIGHGRSRLPEVLAGAAQLPVRFAVDHETIQPNHIYVAPTDRHLLIEPGVIRLSRGPREHFTRPAIDPLFRSAAVAYTTRVIGVVLSGGGSDGAAGLDAIKRSGGLAVVLDPNDAEAAEMPMAAAEIADPDYIVPEHDLGPLLLRLSRQTAPEPGPQVPASIREIMRPQPPVALTCPECGGALRKTGNGSAARYRCHTGHAFGAPELLPAQLDALEKALGTAHRVLNERIEFARQMVDGSRANGRSCGEQYWRRIHDEAESQVEAIREVLSRGSIETDQVPEEVDQ
jgi:two-component system, chemotaxis family, protein-glutamate methylesterase/glutaminase